MILILILINATVSDLISSHLACDILHYLLHLIFRYILLF